MIRFDHNDYLAMDRYEAEEAYKRERNAWFDQNYPLLSPEELAKEHLVMAQDQALRDQGNFYSRRQDDDFIAF